MEIHNAIKLLAIDDRPDILAVLCDAVWEALPQATVLTATDGPAGIALAAAEDPDVILLGIVMPGIDGFEVCRRLKADERLKLIPVVFVTDLKTDAASRVKALEVGVEGFLAKPLEPAELTAQVRAMVKVKAANRSQRLEKEHLEALVAERTRALQESERFVRSTLDSLAAHIAILDASGAILAVNEAWRRFAELNPPVCGSVCEGANYLAICDAVRGDEQGAAQEFAAAIRRVLSGAEQEYALEYPCHSPTERRWFLGRVTRFVGEGPTRVVVAHHNITERKQAEEALRESEARYRFMAENIGDVLWVMDVATQRFTYVSPSVMKLRGYTPEEVMEQPVAETLTPDSRQQVQELMTTRLLQFKAHPQTLQFMTDPQKPVSYVNEADQPCKDGSIVHTEVTTTWSCRPEGQLQIIGVSRDITERKRVEAALRKSEEEYRSLLQSVQVGVVAHAPDTSILFSNPRASQLLGLTPDQMRGKTAIDEAWCFIRENQTRMPLEEYPVNQVLATKQPLTDLTLGILRPDRKEPTWVQCNAHPDWDIHGNLQQVVVSFADITARKQAEQALQESESRLRAIGDNLPTTNIYQLRIESNGAARFTYLSAGVEQLHECTVEEALGDISLLFNRIHPEDVPGWMAFTEKSAGELSVFDHELRIRRKSGEIRWHRMISKPRRTADGATLFDGIDIDITERKQAEEEREHLSAEVRAQARQMAQILATVPAGVLLLDAAGQVLRANTVAAGDLAALAGVAVGDTLTRLGDRPLAELLTAPPTRGVWHEVKSAGRTFEVIARPVEDDPEPELWVLVINDVTREREIQAQLQQQAQLAAVGQLAAGIAHDFNNIMAVIVLYTQLGLTMADVPPKLRQRLEVILEQSHRASDLIQQIMDFSRRSVLERRPLDLLLFLKEIVKLLERTLPESISIELAYAQDEYTVGADPTRMQQAIMNLATNARDAMRSQGGGKLRITLSRTAATDAIYCATCGQVFAGDQWVRIAVTDSGSGIPPEALSHIFEPFFTTKEVGKGTGLGLAQVYGIVKQHEGHINVVTEVGRGTTFNLYLPASPVQPPEAPALDRETPIRGQGETVLVVEDNADLRDALVGTLELLNYRTLQAASGRQALAVLEQRADEIALVLSDLVMPEMGGQALFHALRQRGLTLPVVILSGHPAEDELKALQAQGLAGWMLKPPDGRQLGQLLARVLHKEPDPG